MSKVFDLTGQRFGRLVAIRLDGKSKSGLTIWLCKCDCGNKARVVAADLRRGKQQSCGCLRSEKAAERLRARKLPEGEAAFNSLFYDYRYNAKVRGLSFDLSREEFREMIRRPCVYCGSPPINVYTKHNCAGSLLYNGVDRVDNDAGYSVANCVPCCRFCNYAKGGGTKDDFLAWIRRLKEVT